VCPTTSDNAPNDLIFLAGHQPQMVHPGVWLKNFTLGGLAQRHGATAVNLVVDSDTCAATSLRVPTDSIAEPRAEQIAFDQPEPTIPYEERKIEDRELFANFERRVTERIAPLVTDPLIRQYWPMVAARAKHTDNLGACIAQARHQLEGEWGLQTLEVPQSAVCAGEAFQWFIAHLLADLPRFRGVYNEAIRRYRREHRIRSTAHPAPELTEDGDWLETPFWVWTADRPQRQRLFARRDGRETVLADRESWEARLPLHSDGDGAAAVTKLLELQGSGVRIRSRALVTTLWARVALGDLFIHGIGGAKYDEVTDRIIERFFGFEPPGLMVVSGTLFLPVELPKLPKGTVPFSSDENRGSPPLAPSLRLRAIRNELRETLYHPEHFLDGAANAPIDMIAMKQRWIATPQTRENARERCRAIRAANAALQPLLAEQRRQLAEREMLTARLVEVDQVLTWREYGFCLYPEEVLREFTETIG
jgi:hypothetical protein